MILVKGARVLSDRREAGVQRGERLTVQTVSVNSSDDVGTSLVNLAVDDKRCSVERSVSGNDRAVRRHMQQFLRLNLGEVPPERRSPESLRIFWVSGGDMSRDSLVQTEFRQNPIPADDSGLATTPLNSRYR